MTEYSSDFASTATATPWAPVPGNLLTRWAEEIHPDQVLPEYPRPQMVRPEWLSLNGLWDYAIAPLKSSHPVEKADSVSSGEIDRFPYEGQILVPFPVESALSGVRKSITRNQLLWYKRTFSVPEEWRGKNILLHFGAVDWKAKVWLNRHKVGEHTGGYYPFQFEISNLLTEGENEIIVGVWDPTNAYGQERGKQVLRPGGIFYTAVSGIWQTVWLEPVPKQYIRSVKLTPDIDSEILGISLKTGRTSPGRENDITEDVQAGTSLDDTANVTGMVTDTISSVGPVFYDTESDTADCSSLRISAVAYDGDAEVASGECSVNDNLQLVIKDAKLWSPDSPFLYQLKVRLLNGNEIVDEIGSYFGMRKFSTGMDQGGIMRLFLNNKPLFQHGVLDQGYWPDGLYTAPTEEALEYDVKLAKQFGFNMIRKHIKVEPARWYYHCDKLGLIVWQDMINGGSNFSVRNHLILPNLLRHFRLSDRNYRKSGRTSETNRQNYKKELKEMIDTLYNAACIGTWVPFNEGWGQFDAAETAEWVKDYDPTRCVDHASGWNDQGAGDIKSLHSYFVALKIPRQGKAGGRTVAITEYGGYSMKSSGHVWREDKEFGYRKFTSPEYLQTAFIALLRSQIKSLIPNGLSAAVYTQLTDVETEINGLVTYDRAIVKVDPARTRELAKELV